MTALVWDKTGEKTYQTGVDRGVLFLQDGTAVVWNGLTSVEDTTTGELSENYIDGIKYLQYISPGDFSANLKAFTYPDEFDTVCGVIKPQPGLNAHDQPAKSFSLSYRTRVGDDLSGIDAGYIIHLLYNILANPESHEYPTIGESPEPTEFSWVLTARPDRSSGAWRPTSHMSVDSRDISPTLLRSFEDLIYGTSESSPSLPTIDELVTFFTP